MWKQRLAAYVYPFQHPAWGLAHVRRVLEMSLWLAEEEKLPVDQEALVAAAYLHDMGSFKPFRVKGQHHGHRSAEIAEQLLTKVGFPCEKAGLVKQIINGHMYYSDPEQGSEARVFHDADVLDCLGAIGIARWLSIVGLDDLTPDLPSAIRLIERFSQELPERVQTETAQKKAATRVKEMKDFLANLSEESENLQLL